MINKKANTEKLIKELEEEKKRAQALAEFDSWAFIETPQPRIQDNRDYRGWWMALEEKWMMEFNGNKDYCTGGKWAGPSDELSEDGIGGNFRGKYVISKFYRFDGTIEPFSDDDFRARRGVLIRAHYSPHDVVKVHMIADNLVEFLTQEGIKHNRTNRKRD